VPDDRRCCKYFVISRGLLKQAVGGVEAVDEHSFSATTFRVREQVKHLEPGRVGEVGCIGMRTESKVSVGCIFHCEVGCKVVESTLERQYIPAMEKGIVTVVCFANEGDALDQLFCFLR